jgi:hypothetical protein
MNKGSGNQRERHRVDEKNPGKGHCTELSLAQTGEAIP